MYPPHLVAPMRAQLTDNGFTSLETAEAVDNFSYLNHKKRSASKISF